MRYFTIFILLAIVLLLLMTFYISFTDEPKFEEPQLSTENNSFDIEQLDGIWIGSGFLNVTSDSGLLTLEGEYKFLYDASDSSFQTETSLTGHEFSYQDNGTMKFNDDSLVWTLSDVNSIEMQYRGVVENGTLTAIYNSDKLQYKLQLYFSSSDALTLKHELYQDTTLSQSFEFLMVKQE